MKSLKARALGLTMLALIVTASTVGRAQAADVLKWKLKKDQKLSYEMTQNMDMGMMVAGMAIDMKMSNIMDLDWTVTAVKSDGSAEITQRIGRIRFTMTGGPIGKVAYDTENPKDAEGGALVNQFKGSFDAIVGKDIKLTLSPEGAISDMELSDETKAALKKASGGAAPGGGGISEDTFKQMTSQMGAFFPKGAVEKGQTWNQKFEMKNPAGDIEVATKFQYAGMVSEGGEKLAKIETTPKLTMTAKDGGPAIKVTDKGGKGVSFFDASAGVLSSSKVNQNLEMEISAGGQMTTMTVKSVTEMKKK